jgi:hypothetical protein
MTESREQLAWVSGLVYRDGYSLMLHASSNAERTERLYRSDAEAVWAELHGDTPRTETVWEDVVDHGRRRLKRVTWKLAPN